MPRPPRLRAALLVCAVSLAGCGSQVPNGVTVDSSGSGNGLSITPQQTQTTTPDGASVVPGGGGPLAPGVVATASSGPVAPGGGGGVAGPAAQGPRDAIPTTGKGWDAKNVYIGIVTQKDAQQAFAAFGAKNVDPGDTEAQARAVANHINQAGGILGRKVQLVFRDLATLDTATNADGAGTAVCTYFTQDRPVVAVMSIVTLLDYPNFRACMAKGKTPLFSATVKAIDDKGSAELAPYFYQTIAVSWDALAPVLVSRLKAQGWFSGWNTTTGAAGPGRARVGVLVDGTTVGTRTGKTLQRVLAQAGYPDSLVYQYSQASDGQSKSVQYFSQNGVTHVIVTDVELTAFQNSAAGQQYRPRYGVSSYNDPYTNLEAGGLTPAGANNGALGVGYAPTLDVAQSRDPGTTPGAASCTKLMAAAGQGFSGKRLAQGMAYAMCDSLLLIAEGANAGGGFSGTSIAQGILAIRAGFQPANGFGPALTATKHFVPGKVRDLAWGSGCSCFTYGPVVTPL